MHKRKTLICCMILLLAVCVGRTLRISAMDTAELTATNMPIVINRTNFVFSDYDDYKQILAARQNCYGYALQVYSLWMDYDSDYNVNNYKQQPGEFANDSQSFSMLRNQYISIYSSSANSILNFIEQKMYADFNTLYATDSNEWVIQNTTATASVPNGYRKIALSLLRQNVCGATICDVHFYVRHSDGTWTHKRGNAEATNLSIDSKTVITDANVSTKVTEGGYTAGTRYYLIKKSSVADYPHYNGHEDSALMTPTAFTDKAGDVITKSAIITSSTQPGYFDYAEDIDFYTYTANVPGSTTFRASAYMSNSDLDMVIYDSYGNLLAQDLQVGDPTVTVLLQTNQRIFIKLSDSEHEVTNYTLTYTR